MAVLWWLVVVGGGGSDGGGGSVGSACARAGRGVWLCGVVVVVGC